MPLQTASSQQGVHDTTDRAVAAVEARGLTVFARIDHAGAARGVGLELADEELLVFGDPRVGTLLMQSDAAFGYELPLRLLVWDAHGDTKVGYRPASQLAAGYALEDRADVLARIDQLMADLAREITTQ
jgi:uncharacterized protein (DUF302 family)